MVEKKVIRLALQLGRAKADEVVDFRIRALRQRARALAKRRAALREDVRTAPSVTIPKAVAAAAGSSGVLVAEGDSWFDYPWTDILRLLEDQHGYDVESVAHKGDRVEEMAYSGGQLEEFSRASKNCSGTTPFQRPCCCRAEGMTWRGRNSECCSTMQPPRSRDSMSRSCPV